MPSIASPKTTARVAAALHQRCNLLGALCVGCRADVNSLSKSKRSTGPEALSGSRGRNCAALPKKAAPRLARCGPSVVKRPRRRCLGATLFSSAVPRLSYIAGAAICLFDTCHPAVARWVLKVRSLRKEFHASEEMMRAASGWSSRSPGQKPGVETLAPSRRSAASVSIRGATVFEVDRGVSDPCYTRLDSELIEVPVFGAGTAWRDGKHCSFQSVPIRSAVCSTPRMVPSSWTRTRVPGPRALARSSPIYIVVRL